MTLISQAVAELATSIFGSDWGAPMSRLTGINQRTLLRIKAAAAEGSRRRFDRLTANGSNPDCDNRSG